MRIAFIDDSKQVAPTRDGMGRPLYGGGAVLVDESVVAQLEAELEDLCKIFGFPAGEPFKWSPGRELWMRTGLVEDLRRDFFVNLARMLRDAGGEVVVVTVDADVAPATGSSAVDRDVDAIRLLLKTLRAHLADAQVSAVVIMDRPGGDAARQRRFVEECFSYARGLAGGSPGRLPLPPLPCESRLMRLLQAADVIASCSLAAFSGELNYAPPIFSEIRPMLVQRDGRVGEVGCVFHPPYRYVNLYHWILGDGHYRRGPVVSPLPLARRPYATDEWIHTA